MDAELITNAPLAEVLEHLQAVVAAEGWRLGDDAGTPHRLALAPRPRGRSAAYTLAGPALWWDAEWAERLATRLAGPVAFNGVELRAWTDGEPTARLDRSRNGDFRGVPWPVQATAPSPDLPAGIAAALQDPHGPADLRDRLLDAWYGPHAGAHPPVAVLHRAYDRSFVDDLRPLIAPVRDALARTGAADLRGFATFARHELRDGGTSVRGQVTPAVRSALADDGTLDLKAIGQGLPSGARAVATRALLAACHLAASQPVDVLLADGLALGLKRYPGYQSLSPRTGQAVEVPGAVAPYLVLDWT